MLSFKSFISENVIKFPNSGSPPPSKPNKDFDAIEFTKRQAYKNHDLMHAAARKAMRAKNENERIEYDSLVEDYGTARDKAHDDYWRLTGGHKLTFIDPPDTRKYFEED